MIEVGECFNREARASLRPGEHAGQHTHTEVHWYGWGELC